MIEFNKKYFEQVARDVFLTDSPTGFTNNVINVIKKYNYKHNKIGDINIKQELNIL